MVPFIQMTRRSRTKRLDKCRLCTSSELDIFLDLGFAPPSDLLISKDNYDQPQEMFPLQVQQCRKCGLTQTVYAVDPSIMYGKNYLYEASITRTGVSHFHRMAESIQKTFRFPAGALAVDIGSNVGVLLEGFQKQGFRVLGIDPAPNICGIANRKGIETWQDFMSSEVAARIARKKSRAFVVTATNVFGHIHDKQNLLAALDILLEKRGIFVIEVPYLVDLIANLEYDTIYHEHLEYLSVKPIHQFFSRNGFEIVNWERNSIHGNSIRIFLARKNMVKGRASVSRILELEEKARIYEPDRLKKFAADVRESAKSFRELLVEIRNNGKKCIGISAPAKGNTILNYCKIDTSLISCMIEKSKLKRGFFTPGMKIPILGEEGMARQQADFGVIFAWNFAKEIMNNSAEFRKAGGRFILPIPKPRILG